MIPSIFDKQLFCITSDNYKEFKPWLYGYRTKNNILQINTELEPNDNGYISEEDDQGCYVCLWHEKDSIHLRTDPIGNSLLYLYRQEGFWAISNSYYLLQTTLREKYGIKLTLNKGYVAQILIEGASPILPGESLCDEISLLPANVEIVINLSSGDINIIEDKINQKKISLLSEEGVHLVDKWINKWIGLIRGYANCGLPFGVHVTGGYDSRNSLALTLISGVNMENINFECMDFNDGDLPVAEEIGRKCGFSVNSRLWPTYNILPDMVWDRFKYTRGALNCWHSGREYAYNNLGIRLTGIGGEAHRAAWYIEPNEYCRYHYHSIYGQQLQRDAQSAFFRMIKKFAGVSPHYLASNPKEIMARLYEITRFRLHFGTACSQHLMQNAVSIAPLQDPMLFQLHQRDCPSRDTLFAFIMERIGKNIRYMRRVGNKRFDTETVIAARNLNRTYKFSNTNFGYRPITLRLQPYSYETYAGDVPASDYLKLNVKKCLPEFSKAFPIEIALTALYANECYDTCGAHIPIIAEIIKDQHIFPSASL